MKISLERLLAESSRLQDHRHRNCVICSVTVKSAVLSGRHVKTNVDVYARSSLIPEHTDPSDKTMQCDEDSNREHSGRGTDCCDRSYEEIRNAL